MDLSKDRYNLDVANITNSEAKNITAATPEFSVPIEFTDKSEGSTTEQYPAIANAARAFLLENHTVEKSALHYKEIFLSLKERIK